MDEIRELGAKQADLVFDAARVLEYGRSEPRTWVGFRWQGPRMIALFTDPDAHREKLRSIVEHPDSLDVRWAPFSRRKLDEAYQGLTQMLEQEPQSWSDHGPGVTAVQVHLWSTEQALAERIYHRFGDMVRIRVGQFPFPLDLDEPVRTTPAPEQRALRDLQLKILRAPATVPFGADLNGLARLSNRGTTAIRISTQVPAQGVFVERGLTISAFSGAIAGVSRAFDLAPGATTDVPFLAGTDSLDPARGASLPRGDYDLVVTLPIRDAASVTLVSPPTSVGIV